MGKRIEMEKKLQKNGQRKMQKQFSKSVRKVNITREGNVIRKKVQRRGKEERDAEWKENRLNKESTGKTDQFSKIGEKKRTRKKILRIRMENLRLNKRYKKGNNDLDISYQSTALNFPPFWDVRHS